MHEPEAWVEQLLVAAKSQTVVVPGAETAAAWSPSSPSSCTGSLIAVRRLEKEIERAFFDLPEASISRACRGSALASGRGS